MPSYNKLVRDRIPEIIRGKGQTPVTHILDDQAYLKALLDKLEEEIAEFREDLSVEELADVQEVVRGLAKAIGVSLEDLEATRAAKAEKNGAFEQKIFLENVE